MYTESGRYILIKAQSDGTLTTIETLTQLALGSTRLKALQTSEPDSEFYLLDTLTKRKIFADSDGRPELKEKFGVFIEDGRGPVWRCYVSDRAEATRKAQEIAAVERLNCFIFSFEEVREVERFFPSQS